MTSSAISHQVRALEDWLGLKLFERSTRTVELTDFGIRYSLELGALLGRLEKISHTEPGQRKNNKVITIQTTDSFASRWLLPRLPEFESLHPDITIKIVTYDFRDGLRSSEADVGILFLSADQSARRPATTTFDYYSRKKFFRCAVLKLCGIGNPFASAICRISCSSTTTTSAFPGRTGLPRQTKECSGTGRRTNRRQHALQSRASGTDGGGTRKRLYPGEQRAKR